LEKYGEALLVDEQKTKKLVLKWEIKTAERYTSYFAD
jgi:hypothetical protein